MVHILYLWTLVFIHLLNQYSPVPRARSSVAGKDVTRQREHRSIQAWEFTCLYSSVLALRVAPFSAIQLRERKMDTLV